MRKILDIIADSIVIIGKDYKIVFANKAMLELCRLKKGDVIGQRCHEIFHGCHEPCGSACLFDALCPHAEIFKTGKAVSVTHQHIMPDGRELFFDITASPIRDEKGGVIQIIEVLRDVTELKKADKLTKNILETVDEGFIIIDRDFRIISANRAYADEVKMPLEDILGRHCYEISHHLVDPCKEAQHPCAVRQVFGTGRPYTAMHTHYDKHGNHVYVQTKAYPLSMNGEGKVITAIEVITDISEKVKLEDQLRHAQKMEAVGQLSGGIAHDFNNILQAIIGYSSVLKMKMKEDDPNRYIIQRILESGERAANLTQSLLAFSRKQILSLKTADTNQIIRKVGGLLQRVISEDIEFKTVLSDKGLNVLADAGQIEQVLINLATNARDAMPDGGNLIISTELAKMDKSFVSAHGYGKPGRYALISVSDTGIGMDEETRLRIFEPFFTTKEVGKGTGLGLSIVYGIVKQHDGYINVYSEPGKGATFKIYLPVTEEKVKEEELIESITETGGAETILLAEDDESVRKFTKSMLEQSGYTVIEAVDGEDALNKFKENKDNIELLLFDIIMPKMDGKTAYDRIAKISPDIKVIFTSGYTQEHIAKKGVLEEGIEFIYKPVSPTELLKKVKEVIGK